MSAKNIKLSATRIHSFAECKLKYWFNYEEHLPRVDNPAFKLGTSVHEALEMAGRIWKAKENFSKEDVTTILKKYRESAIREGIEDLSIFAEGKRLIKLRLDNFHLGKIIGLEVKFGFNGTDDVTTPEGVPLIGAIDKVVALDEDSLLIVDYKTSKNVPTRDQLENDAQLSIYDLVAQIKWPEYKRIILSLDLLKSDMVYTYRTPAAREEFRDYIKSMYDQMLIFTKKEAKPTLNIFCPWCEYREYCTAYQKACKETGGKFLAVTSLSDEKLIKEWKHVRSIKKILEERERELGMVMTEKIKRFGMNIDDGDDEIFIRQTARVNYDAEKLAKVIPPEDFAKLINSLNKKAVEEYAETNPRQRELILSLAETNFSSPFLAVKKLKGKEIVLDVEE